MIEGTNSGIGRGVREEVLLGSRIGALLVLPKMMVATYGHLFVENFDAGFDHYYTHAIKPGGNQAFAKLNPLLKSLSTPNTGEHH